MELAFALALMYLAVNLLLTVWLERDRARGDLPSGWLVTLSAVLRYGPPLAGAIYLIAISGDWVFVGFVLLFFAGAAWLLNGLLAFTNHGPDGRRDTRRDDY